MAGLKLTLTPDRGESPIYGKPESDDRGDYGPLETYGPIGTGNSKRESQHKSDMTYGSINSSSVGQDVYFQRDQTDDSNVYGPAGKQFELKLSTNTSDSDDERLFEESSDEAEDIDLQLRPQPNNGEPNVRRYTLENSWNREGIILSEPLHLPQPYLQQSNPPPPVKPKIINLKGGQANDYAPVLNIQQRKMSLPAPSTSSSSQFSQRQPGGRRMSYDAKNPLLDLAKQNYFNGSITKEVATKKLLKKNKDGYYILRNSGENDGYKFALTIFSPKLQKKIVHVHITCDRVTGECWTGEVGPHSCARKFQKVTCLMEYWQQNGIFVENVHVKLVKPLNC